jgi:hypothetical protein
MTFYGPAPLGSRDADGFTLRVCRCPPLAPEKCSRAVTVK